MVNEKETKEKNSVLRIVSYVISLICLVLCIVITIEVINANVNNRPPRIFGLSISHVPSASMEPTIDTGDYVMFSKASFEDVNVDDIIVYRSGDGRYIIHRIIEKNSEYIVTQGDNRQTNPVPDSEHVTPDMVYGKYITTVGLLDFASGGISKNLIFFILIFIFIGMITMQIVSIVIKQKTEKIKKSNDDEKKLLLEQLKKEILEEELAKLRSNKNDEDNK